MTRLRKLPARFAPLVTAFLLSLLMTCVVSLIATIRSVGLSSAALSLWPGNWAMSWLVAFPLILVVMPVVKRLSSALLDPPVPPPAGQGARTDR
jgi:hypothetical protein